MSEQWLSVTEALSAIKDHVGSGIGRSEHILESARKSGEVRHRNDVLVLAADDGIIQTVHGINADGRSVVHHIHPIRPADYDEFSEDDLLDWLSRQQFPDQKPDSKPAARRTPPEQARALKAMKAIYGKIPPQDEVSNPVLEQAVNKHLKQEGLEAVKKDAIQRAAGRRR
jgi:hypothetical protein